MRDEIQKERGKQSKQENKIENSAYKINTKYCSFFGLGKNLSKSSHPPFEGCPKLVLRKLFLEVNVPNYGTIKAIFLHEHMEHFLGSKSSVCLRKDVKNFPELNMSKIPFFLESIKI